MRVFCLHVCRYAPCGHTLCPQKSEKCVRFPGFGVTDDGEPVWVLRIKLLSSTRTTNSLNSCAVSPAPYNNFLKEKVW